MISKTKKQFLYVAKSVFVFLVTLSWIFSPFIGLVPLPKKFAEKFDVPFAYAAIAYDAGSESHTGTSGSASEASFSWTHTPVGTPKGALVFVFTNADADYITSVTYGGTTMTRVSGGQAIDTAGEAGRTDTFFLGSSVPTSSQTVTVTRTNNTTVMYATAMTVTADRDTETTGFVLLQNNQTLAEQSVDDGSPGSNSVRFAGINSGLPDVPAAGTNSTVVAGIDLGARVVQVVRETTAGQGARSIGFSSGTSDDVAAVHVAVREVPTALSQLRYRWRANHQGETGTTWLAAESTVITGANNTTASTTRLRILVDETNTVATTTLYQLEYATTTSAGCSGLTYVRVADQASSTGYAWKMSPTSRFANGAASTDNAGLINATGNFRAGTTQDTAARLSSGIAHAAGEFTELEWSIEAKNSSGVNGQSYCFRVTNADDTTNFTYSVYPKINLATSSPALTQLHSRWRADHQGETGTTWMASEDARLNGATDSSIKTASTTRVRFVVDETGLKTGTSTLFQLEYAENTSGTACSAASYTKVPDTASTEHWEMSASTQITEAAATTNNSGLSDPSSGSFIAGQIHDTSSRFSTAVSINPADNFTEIEWAVKANASNATNGGSYCFRVTNADDATNFTFTQYARVTLATSTTALSQLHYRWRADNGGEIAPGGGANDPPFWDSNFTNRRKITFNNAPSSLNLHDFPVPIKLTADANDEWSAANIDYTKTRDHGFDVRFVNASSTLMLKHEVENWNESGTSTVWVKLPFLEAATTTQYIWMYYNNTSTTTSGAATSSVWDTNFKGVWHFAATSTAARQFIDSTSNSLVATTTGFDSDEVVATSFLNGALDFDGTNDVVITPKVAIGTNLLTVSFWLNWDAFAGDDKLAIESSRTQNSFDTAIMIDPNSSTAVNKIELTLKGTTNKRIESIARPTALAWHHYGIVFDNSIAAGEITPYLDGAEAVTTIDRNDKTGALNFITYPWYFLNRGGTTLFGAGILTDVRISNVQRSADWIQAEYRYGAASSTTHSFGSEETYTAGDGAGFLAAEDTHLTGTGVSTASTTRLRMLVDETNSLATTTLYQLEYATSTITGFTSCSALSTWVPVPHAASTTEASYSYAWTATTTASYANRAATTNITSGLTDPASGSFVAGQIMDYNATSTAFQVTANNFTELEWALEATSDADGNSYCFRVTNADSTTNFTYSVYPRISVATSTVTFTQNRYQLYKDNNSLNPGTVWDGLSENAVMTSANERVGGGDVVRLRMNVTVSAALSASAQAFGLQYAELPSGSSCSALTSWTLVGAKGSDTIFRLANTSQGDSTTITTTLLSDSNVGGLLSELNLSATNPNSATANQKIEYDWPVEYATARLSNTTLCFRMVKNTSTALTTYTQYPQILTNIVGTGDGITIGAPVGGSGAKGAATTTGGTQSGSGETGGGAPGGNQPQSGGGSGGGGEVLVPFFRYYANIITGVVNLFTDLVDWKLGR